MKSDKKKIAVIGLGYVGLPLAVEFGKYHSVVGFDIDKKRINELKSSNDVTGELLSNEIAASNNLKFSYNEKDLVAVDIFIITVPTDIDKSKRPNLKPLESASALVGKYIKNDGIVIFESTVYPGCTEEECIPIIEEISKLKCNKDFSCGYSPERIVPGDKSKSFKDILKITSGSNKKAAKEIDELYSSIICAGTYRAPSIKVAEAAKIIENTQRDVNIALMNELAIIFEKVGIDTNEVLDAAATKWNFTKYFPGLVGGHCISVDPYYLYHKALELGYYPEVIASGRRVNNYMGIHVGQKTIKLLLEKNKDLSNLKILILGFAFKENCGDIRNTGVMSIYDELCSFGVNVKVYDPIINKDEATKNYKVNFLKSTPAKNSYDAIILAVPHKILIERGIDGIKKYGKKNAILFDVKSAFPKKYSNARL